MLGCEPFTCVICAFARCAIIICRGGRLTLSASPTTYQDGIVFQPSADGAFSLSAEPVIGRFSDLDLFVSLVFKIEPSTVAFSKAPMAVSEAAVSWASFANLVSAANASSPSLKSQLESRHQRPQLFWRSSCTSGRASLDVRAFLDRLDDFGAESFKITWIPRRDNTLVDDYFRILPMRASIGDVSFDGLERRHPAAFRDTGLDQAARAHDKWPRRLSSRRRCP